MRRSSNLLIFRFCSGRQKVLNDKFLDAIKSRVLSSRSIVLCLQLLLMKLMLSRCGWVKGKFIGFSVVLSYKSKMA